jgi:hypothetical protein
MPIPSATTQVCSPKCDHQRHQIQAGQVRGEQLGQRRLGLRHEPPRHRRPRRGGRGLLGAGTDRFEHALSSGHQQPELGLAVSRTHVGDDPLMNATNPQPTHRSVREPRTKTEHHRRSQTHRVAETAPVIKLRSELQQQPPGGSFEAQDDPACYVISRHAACRRTRSRIRGSIQLAS